MAALTVFVLLGPDIRSEEVLIPVQPVSNLQQLEQKAAESDHYRSQYVTLRKTLGEMMAMLPTEGAPLAAKDAFGQLSVLLDKAAKSDALELKVDELQKELKELQKQCDTLQDELEGALEDRDQAREDLEGFKAADEKWEGTVVGLRETIKRLLLGEFEYYEVKEGDTFQSIAANPMVYGDASRAVWLRQVNNGQIKHLDSLQPGEVLIVPRFPRNGTYEF